MKHCDIQATDWGTAGWWSSCLSCRSPGLSSPWNKRGKKKENRKHTKITLRNPQPSLNGKNRVLSYNKKRITNKSRKGMESCAFLVRVSNSKANMENSKAVN